MRYILRRLVPRSILEARYRLTRIGLRRFLAYRRLERAERRKPAPEAGCRFDIGGAGFVPHATTIPAMRSQRINDGHAILEFRAFMRESPSHRLLRDIGAAEGIYSAAFGAITGRAAWAFEPSAEMYARLLALSACNPELEIRPVQTALGAQPEERPSRSYRMGNSAERVRWRATTWTPLTSR